MTRLSLSLISILSEIVQGISTEPLEGRFESEIWKRSDPVERLAFFAIQLLGRVMRGVSRAGGVVGEERLVRRHGTLRANPADRLVGLQHVKTRWIRTLLLFGFNRLGALEDGGVPLVGVSAVTSRCLS